MNAKRLCSGVVLAALALLALTGCQTFQSSSGELFGVGGIPGDPYRVGGGFQIRYIAPEAGVVYLVEHRTGTLLGTESLNRGQVFEFFPTQEVVDGFKRVDVDLSKGEFVIYFVPSSDLYHR
jgi:hypothetical protein